LYNGLSDHDGQFITINNIAAAGNIIPLRQRTRKINNETVMQFQLLLKNETWESIYNSKFNSFLYSFLNIYDGTFPTKYKNIGKSKNMEGVKISYKHKRYDLRFSWQWV
jgi:hypothetical protein